MMTITLSYEMDYPEVLDDLFWPIKKIGSSADTLLSFDCFAKDAKLTLFAPSNAILKVFLTALLPIILFVLSLGVWIFLHKVFPTRFIDFKRNLVVSTITILFLLHPTLTESSLTLFQ